jgi:DNA-binding MarR family transcriptional regulator
MAGPLPLTALLSQAFVAFTIECDNEFERQMPHRTARDGWTGPRREMPWLTSMVMWFTCLRFLVDEGRSVEEVERLARTSTNWNGMERWGYVDVGPDPTDPRPRPPRKDWIVRATPAGRRAQAVWAPLGDQIERRWQERFGNEPIDNLRERLSTVVSGLDADLPDCLPILGYGLFSRLPERRPSLVGEDGPAEAGPVALPSLVAKVLLSIALEFEDHWPISLAASSDVLGVLDGDGQRLRDLPRRSGVSKEAIAMALGVLTKAGLVELESTPGESPGKVVRLTEAGKAAQLANTARLADIEAAWRDRLGSNAIDSLRTSLEGIVEPDAERSALFRGLVPDPDGWRASVPAPARLPHFPMVLHRGGYPDGS